MSKSEVSHRYYLKHKDIIKERSSKYEKTVQGFLMRKYRNMLSRVTGVNKKATNYIGLSILEKPAFYTWSLADTSFRHLWDAYVASGRDRKLCPSVDRLDTKVGYTEGNMRWITQSENSKLGSISRWSAVL